MNCKVVEKAQFWDSRTRPASNSRGAAAANTDFIDNSPA